jgi:Leucine-rich repeat (LRR) protein
MADNKQNNNQVSIKGPFSEKDLRPLKKYSRIENLALTKQSVVTAKIASGLSCLQSVRKLWLWSSVTRTAMRHIISLPDLEVLDILEIRHPGKLTKFSEAISLKEFRCNHFMTEADLLEISMLPKLQELGAQNSAISRRTLEAFLQMPKLEHIDLEATDFDDEMATIVSKSNIIKHLEIGASKLTSNGFKKISEMSQLQSLDIWATNIQESDLKLLSKLPKLEYLSIGGYIDQTRLTSKGVLPCLKDIPSLKRLWLDGVVLTENEKKELEETYE